MLGYLSRITAAFLVLLITYWCYALTVAPLIEPRLNYPSKPDDAFARGPGDRPDNDRMRDFLPPGAWELDSRKVIETAQGKLLFKDYQPLDDGQIRIQPCTLIFYASSGRQKKDGRPIIMRTPEGALLQFDRPLDLARADIGRLIGGRLLGEVTISSPETDTGEGDELHIVTSNVHLAEDHVKTPNTVRFRYGKNTGSGRDLRITLVPSSRTGDDVGGPMFDGVRKLELFHLDNIRLFTGGKGPFARVKSAAPGGRPASSPANGSDEPVDITCAGGYQFDFESNVASFEDQVVVVHQTPGFEDDRLTCDRLEIVFAPREAEAEGEAEAARDASAPQSVPLAGLTVQRLIARGAPAVLTSPAQSSVARGEHLEYDFASDQIYLEDSRKVVLRGPHQYVEGEKLRYEMSPEGSLGRVWADGPGRFEGALRAEGGRHVAARWSERLRLQPHDGVHVLALVGAAEVRMEQSGGFSAEEIYLWLREIPKLPAGLAGRNDKAGGTKTDVVPDRMLALRSVDIDSPRLTGKTERLEAWFRYAPPAPLPPAASAPIDVRALSDRAAAARAVRLTAMKQPHGAPPAVVPQSRFAAPPGGSLATPTYGATGPPHPAAGAQPQVAVPRDNHAPPPQDATKPPPKKFDLNGKLVRVQLLQRPDVDPEVEAVAIDGEVHFREVQQAGSNEPPLDIRGDTLRITAAEQAQAVVRVFGRPARVSARGMTMSGSNVQLDRGANRLWIEGAGTMLVPPDRNASAAAPKAPIHISWQEGMEFDGNVVRFRRDVRTRTRETNDEGGWTETTSVGDTLDATVSRFVDFAAEEQPEDVELRRLVYDGGVFVESRGVDRRGAQKSWDRTQIPNLTIDQLTGEILSEGAGWIRSVQLGDRNLLQDRRTAAPPTQHASRDESPQLTYTRVVYQQGITGNLHRREIVFRDQVETVHGPIPAWDAELSPDRPESLGERGVVVTCDQLSLYEMGPWVTKRRRAFELLASGNAIVEGRTFNAQAARITYAEAKDLIVLEGDGRSNAELWRQVQVGGERSYAAARKILYWKGENRFEVDNARFLDLTQFGAP